MLRSQLRREAAFGSPATRASDRTLAPADDRSHAAQQARYLTRPPETLANLLGSALRLSSRANGAVTLFGHCTPDGVRPGSDPIFRSRTCSIALGRRRYAPPRRGRVQFRGIKTPPPGVSPKGGRSDRYPDGLSTTPVLCRDRYPLTGGVGEYCGRCIGVAWKRSWGGGTETRQPRVITRESRRGLDTWARRSRVGT